jgi:anti-sigma regulatory factor (Ser/Thr protein kinase)
LSTSRNVEAPYERAYAQTSKAVSRARCDVVAFARACGFTGQELADIEIAVGEGLANAFEHGQQESVGFAVSVRWTDGSLVIEIKDGGCGFDPAQRPCALPPAEALRGFGMFIMRELMDEIDYSERGTRLRLRKRRCDPRSRTTAER